MFTKEDLDKIERLLAEGLSPQSVADEFSLTISAFRVRLTKSGWEVEVSRKLRPITPVARDAQSTPAIGTA